MCLNVIYITSVSHFVYERCIHATHAHTHFAQYRFFFSRIFHTPTPTYTSTSIFVVSNIKVLYTRCTKIRLASGSLAIPSLSTYSSAYTNNNCVFFSSSTFVYTYIFSVLSFITTILIFNHFLFLFLRTIDNNAPNVRASIHSFEVAVESLYITPERIFICNVYLYQRWTKIYKLTASYGREELEIYLYVYYQLWLACYCWWIYSANTWGEECKKSFLYMSQSLRNTISHKVLSLRMLSMDCRAIRNRNQSSLRF